MHNIVPQMFFTRDTTSCVWMAIVVCRSSFGIGVLGLMTYQERADDDSSSSAVLSVYIAINRSYRFEHFAL
jgi:hypothetical protein